MQTALYATGLFVVGVLYRATFISGGLSNTDEGWLQTIAARIVRGEVPYRDFNFILPPVSIWKEAILIRLFGDAYGLLAGRFEFAIETSLASVLAFLIIRRVAGSRLAFLLTLPTLFFTVILYIYPSYTADAAFFALLGLALLLRSGRGQRITALLAGVSLALAFLSKPPWLALLPLVIVLGVLAGRNASPSDSEIRIGLARGWRLCILGFVLTMGAVAAYFAAEGALKDYVYGAYFVKPQTFHFGVFYLVWQDLPAFLFKPPHAGGAAAILLILVLAVGLPARFRRVEPALLLVVLVAILAGAIARPEVWGWHQLILGSAYGFLLAVNVGAALLILLGRRHHPIAYAKAVADLGIPVELPLLAAAVQYCSQYGYTGILYSYEGCFLSIPTALLILYRSSRLPRVAARWPSARLAVPRVAPIAVGLWLMAAGALVTHDVVYYDAPRAALTATFQSAKLAGLRSTPAHVQRVDRIVTLVQQRTKPGDPILVVGDFPDLYYLTDRTNPTRQDWYLNDELLPSITERCVDELRSHPARLVLLPRYSEFDLARSTPVDYQHEPKLAPLYRYITANYRSVGQVDDIDVLVPID